MNARIGRANLDVKSADRRVGQGQLVAGGDTDGQRSPTLGGQAHPFIGPLQHANAQPLKCTEFGSKGPGGLAGIAHADKA